MATAMAEAETSSLDAATHMPSAVPEMLHEPLRGLPPVALASNNSQAGVDMPVR